MTKLVCKSENVWCQFSQEYISLTITNSVQSFLMFTLYHTKNYRENRNFKIYKENVKDKEKKNHGFQNWKSAKNVEITFLEFNF